MPDLLKGLIGIVLWFFLTFGLYKGCAPNCDQLPFCGHDHVPEVAPPVTVKKVQRYPLDFQWSDATSYTNERFSDFKTKILAETSDSSNILEIVGLFYEGEENTSVYADMGIARANKVKELFIDDLPEDRIKLTSTKLPALDKPKEGYYESVEFNWISNETGSVEILADRVIIRFPYNSVQQDFDPRIEAYLNELAAALKNSGKTVRLTGHTDNQGDIDKNEILAHRRAKMIRDMLRQKGVKHSQIKTFTKGETEPISSNDTEEGRHNNRRVEVQISTK